MSKVILLRWVVVAAGAVMLLVLAAACTREVVKEVPVEKVVTKEVVKEVQVPGETVVVEKEVVREVQVPGETVVVSKEVVREVQVPGETVVVEKEVVREVQVPGETVVVEKEVVKEVQVPGETVVVEKEVVKEVRVPGETVVVEKEVVKEVEKTVVLDRITRSLRVVLHTEPAPNGLYGIDEAIGQSWVDGLTWHDTDNPPYAVRPRLAREWENISPTQWRFKLEEGVSFQNGEPFNAEAAAYGIAEATKPGVSGGFIYFLAGTTPTPIVVDQYTLDINCDKPCPIMPKSLAYTAFVAPTWFAGASEEERRSDFVGIAPFKLVEWKIGERMLFERVEDYWAGRPENIDTVTVLTRVEPAVRAAMLQTNEVDWAYALSSDDISRIPNYVVGQTTEHIQLPLNLFHEEALKDVRVREALAISVDCQTIAKALYGGLPTCRGTPFHLATLGARPDIMAPRAYNPERAKQLLEEANFKERFPDFVMSIVTRDGRFPKDVEFSEAVAGYWKAVGIPAEVKIFEPSVWGNRTRTGKDDPDAYDTYVNPHGNDILDGFTSMHYVRCDIAASAVCDPKLQAMIEKSGTAFGAEREQLVYDVWKYVYDQFYEVIFFQMPIIYGLSRDVEFTPRANRRVRWDEDIRWIR